MEKTWLKQYPAGVPAEIEFFGSPAQFIVYVFGVFAAPTATAMTSET